jgi:hypothetical protein
MPVKNRLFQRDQKGNLYVEDISSAWRTGHHIAGMGLTTQDAFEKLRKELECRSKIASSEGTRKGTCMSKTSVQPGGRGGGGMAGMGLTNQDASEKTQKSIHAKDPAIPALRLVCQLVKHHGERNSRAQSMKHQKTPKINTYSRKITKRNTLY